MTAEQIATVRAELQRSVHIHNGTVWHPSGKKYDDPVGTKRDREEADEELSNRFQEDKERIVLCKAFRRLKHKTQVFWAPRNDHFRTRLTHTIEVSQTARRIGSLLGLNTGLIEAISFGHDIGHPPFGHAGERRLKHWIEWYLQNQATKALNAPDRDPDYDRLVEVGFEYDHHTWAWKILQHQEELPYSQPDSPKGLNLTALVQGGIKDPSLNNTTSLEAQVVGVADDLTWINHDEDDFKQAGITLPSATFNAVRRFGGTRTERMTRAVQDIVWNSLQDTTHIHMSSDLQAVIDDIAKAQHELYRSGEHWQRHETGAEVVLGHLLKFYVTGDPEDIRTVIKRLVGRGSTGAGGEEEVSFS